VNKKYYYVLVFILIIIFIVVVNSFGDKTKINTLKYPTNLKFDANNIRLVYGESKLDFLIGSLSGLKHKTIFVTNYRPYRVKYINLIFKNNKELFKISNVNPQLDKLYVSLEAINYGSSEFKVEGTIEWLDPKVYESLYSPRSIEYQDTAVYTEEDLYTGIMADFESDYTKVKILDHNPCDDLQILSKNIDIYSSLPNQMFHIDINNNSDFDMNIFTFYMTKNNLFTSHPYSKSDYQLIKKNSNWNLPFSINFYNLNLNDFKDSDNNLVIVSKYYDGFDIYKCNLSKKLNINIIPQKRICEKIEVIAKDNSYVLTNSLNINYLFKVKNNSNLNFHAIKKLELVSDYNEVSFINLGVKINNNGRYESVNHFPSEEETKINFQVLFGSDFYKPVNFNVNYKLILYVDDSDFNCIYLDNFLINLT